MIFFDDKILKISNYEEIFQIDNNLVILQYNKAKLLKIIGERITLIYLDENQIHFNGMFTKVIYGENN